MTRRCNDQTYQPDRFPRPATVTTIVVEWNHWNFKKPQSRKSPLEPERISDFTQDNTAT